MLEKFACGDKTGGVGEAVDGIEPRFKAKSAKANRLEVGGAGAETLVVNGEDFN